MIPIITLIGRNYVGKSTIFNQLINKNNALISKDDLISTRDRNHGYLNYKNFKISIYDTAGIKNFINLKKTIEYKILQQTKIAIKEAHLIFLVLNANDGVTFQDREILGYLRKKSKNIFLIVNQIDKINKNQLIFNEYYILGIKHIIFISAISKKNIHKLIKINIIPWIKTNQEKLNLTIKKFDKIYHPKIKICIIGKPNVGKSTLLNSLINEERVVTHNLAGTTRDYITVTKCHENKNYQITDTAGIEKKNKIKENIQYLAKYKTIDQIRKSNICILIIDYQQKISKKDLLILNEVINIGKSLIIIINKSENICIQEKKNIKNYLIKKNKFIKFIQIHFISALYNIGINKIFDLINEVYKTFNKNIKSSKLTKIMQYAIQKNPIPLIKGKEIKLKYAHVVSYQPFIILIHGNKTSFISNTYKKYLINFFQKKLNIKHTCIKIIFKKNNNPYVNSKH
ncbi:GTPase Der [Buchnera aphidicola (Symydobius americanus)]